MSAPEWLKWINPAPQSDDEVRQFEAQIQVIIHAIKPFIENDQSHAQMKKAVHRIAGHLEKIKAELENLPIALNKTYQSWADQVHRLDTEVSSHIPLITEPRKGRPKEADKTLCIAYCNALLHLNGKAHGLHRTGPVSNLARWVWVAAGGHDMSTPNAWGALTEQIAGERKTERPPMGRKGTIKCRVRT